MNYTVGNGIAIWKVALAIHICGWLLQFIGHGVFEGKLEKFKIFINII